MSSQLLLPLIGRDARTRELQMVSPEFVALNVNHGAVVENVYVLKMMPINSVPDSLPISKDACADNG